MDDVYYSKIVHQLKKWPGTNTPAYFVTASVIRKKRFITMNMILPTGDNVIKLLFLYHCRFWKKLVCLPLANLFRLDYLKMPGQTQTSQLILPLSE